MARVYLNQRYVRIEFSIRSESMASPRGPFPTEVFGERRMTIEFQGDCGQDAQGFWIEVPNGSVLYDPTESPPKSPRGAALVQTGRRRMVRLNEEEA